MKWLTISILVTSSVCSVGQPIGDKKFRLGIILPDTMTIDNELSEYAQAIEVDQLKDYYASLKQMENQLQAWKSRDSLDRFPMTKRTMEKRLDSAKTLEPEMKKYKYFYKVADYSLYHFKSKCEELSSAPDFLVIGTKTPSKKKFKEITENFNLDYLVRYTQITATRKDERFEMKLTATLYSKNLKVLFKDNFSASSKCPNDRLRCVTPFCCMLTNVTNSSASKIYKVLKGLQKK